MSIPMSNTRGGNSDIPLLFGSRDGDRGKLEDWKPTMNASALCM